MKILGINGSPRKGGNTELLLGSFLEGASQAGALINKIILNNLKFVPCQECGDLGRNPICIIQDDMQGVYAKVDDCDVLALAAPIFFGSLSAQSKMMIDRFQCHWRADNLLKLGIVRKKKKAVFLCVEASKRDDFQKNARAIAKNFFATVNAEYSGEVLCRGVDGKGAILKYPGVLKEAYMLGQELAGG